MQIIGWNSAQVAVWDSKGAGAKLVTGGDPCEGKHIYRTPKLSPAELNCLTKIGRAFRPENIRATSNVDDLEEKRSKFFGSEALVDPRFGLQRATSANVVHLEVGALCGRIVHNIVIESDEVASSVISSLTAQADVVMELRTAR
eukprot:SM000013S26600  [mRNA]  locus=s13:1229663:1230801:- [translate_table: standard]